MYRSADLVAEAEHMLESLTQDLRLAWRALSRAKTFTATAILTLALGIAGTTVVFALIHGVLLRPLPVHSPDRLLVAWKELGTSGYAHYPFGDHEIEAVADGSELLEHVAGVTANGVGPWLVVENGVASEVRGALITGDFFAVLGVQPILGRTFTRADDVEGADHGLVISHGLWQRRYGAAPDVLGRRVVVNEQPFTIIGVMPPDLDYPRRVEAWRTTRSVSITGPFGDAARREIDLLARMRPGVTIEQATSELTGLTRELEKQAAPNVPRGLRPVVRSFHDAVVGDVRLAMLALFCAVGLVLLIASANVANLLLMRGEQRRPALAVCAALGASRVRLLRQLLAESGLLAVAAGAAGVAVTWWSLPALLAFVPEGLPRVESVRVDAIVVLFAIGIAWLTAVLAGLAPAFSSMRIDLVTHLRGGGHSVTGPARRYGRRALVVAQVALAVTVVAAAGLLTRSLLRLQTVDTGLAADRLVFIELALPRAKYAERERHAQFLDAAIGQLESLPPIAAVTPVNVRPFTGEQGGWGVPRFTAEGQTADQAITNPALNLESVHPNYFETFGVALRRGRTFTDSDRQGTLEVAIVSEDVAARTWPGQDPIGKRLKIGGPDSRARWRTVVGVVAVTRYRDLARPWPTLYLPAAQFQMTAQILAMRTSAPLEAVIPLARERIQAIDRDVLVRRVAPFTQLIAGPLERPRFNAFLLSLFGIAALLLAMVGLYAVMAAYVRQRDREIALRLALGASGARVRQLVLGEAFRLSGLGAVIGLVGAIGAARLMRALLFEIEPLDPTTIIGAPALLVAAAAVASYLPVRRATRVDAMAMLRSE
jgi:putative ABC transport system permease protein